ncbi:MAG: eukaryotic-like serine/threonine-protein kinase [Blastocatellia bacterium]|nr:eukaryotic-like serine/threonine-protein kinase [Blastocatellia bacterium]
MPTAAGTKFGNRSSQLVPGAILQNRYQIIRQLGRGGMGAVYEALDQRLDAIVALKETFSVDAVLRRQFEQEARLLAQLHHPALPRVSDYFTEGERAFLVMQFISGSDLAEIIAQQPGPFPRNQVIAWADQLLDALIYLHTRDRQIIHRDIKPHNLKVTSNGQIALLDFGLAKTQTTDLSGNSSNSIFGYTRRYSPIEQIQDQGTTPQSDIYALGATLYHLLTGVKPPDALGRAAALANSKPDPLIPAHEVHRAVGPEIAGILCRALALNAEDRYPTANEFRGALARVGRSDAPGVKGFAGMSIAEAASHMSLNTTVLKRGAAPGIDPFGSYSILKPAESEWLLPKANRVTGWIALSLIFVIVAGFGTMYGFGNWTNPKALVFDSTKVASRTAASAAVRQSNPENARARVAGSNTISPAPVGEVNRKVDPQKRRTTRTLPPHPKPAGAKPPPFSITP